jgi:hypothetical protein
MLPECLNEICSKLLIIAAPAAQRFGAFVSRAAHEGHPEKSKQLVDANRQHGDHDRNECVFDPAMTLTSEHVFCRQKDRRRERLDGSPPPPAS